MKNKLFSFFHISPLLFFPSWQIRFSASMCLIYSTMQSIVWSVWHTNIISNSWRTWFPCVNGLQLTYLAPSVISCDWICLTEDSSAGGSAQSRTGLLGVHDKRSKKDWGGSQGTPALVHYTAPSTQGTLRVQGFIFVVWGEKMFLTCSEMSPQCAAQRNSSFLSFCLLLQRKLDHTYSIYWV